jgi:tetratricopeptide (TPR) repeat protein
VLALISLGFLIYSNTFHSPFIFDDIHNIRDNPHIRLSKLTIERITKAGLESPTANRPAANVSFALNYYLHQYDLFGYHLVNILIHVTTGILLYFFLKITLKMPSLHSRFANHKWIPLFTATIWLACPVQTQSITYIVQRMNSMSALFYLLSLLLYASARLAEGRKERWVLYVGCGIAGMISLASKEIALTIPLFIFLYEWYFLQDLSGVWLKRHLFLFVGMACFIAVIMFIFLGTHPVNRLLSGYTTRDFTMIERVLTQFRVVVFYITLILFPHPSRLNLIHDFTRSQSLIDPMTTLLSLGVIVGLVGLALPLAKKDRLISFCILWFFGNLVIESSVIGLELVFEHRTYLPSMFAILAMVTLVYRYIRPQWIAVGFLCIVVVIFSAWTYERNSMWKDNVTIWKDCVDKSPQRARPHYNLGVALEHLGRHDEAANHFSKAVRLKPAYTQAHFNLGVVFKLQGKREKAIAHLLEAVRIRPDFTEAHYFLGRALADAGRLGVAIIHYAEAVKLKPNLAEAHYFMGIALTKQEMPEEAIEHYQKAVEVKPDFAEAHFNLGVALAEQELLAEAIGHYSEAVRIMPDFAEAYNNLGIALARQGRLKEAVANYAKAVEIKPDFERARKNLKLGLRLLEKSVEGSSINKEP